MTRGAPLNPAGPVRLLPGNCGPTTERERVLPLDVFVLGLVCKHESYGPFFAMGTEKQKISASRGKGTVGAQRETEGAGEAGLPGSLGLCSLFLFPSMGCPSLLAKPPFLLDGLS